MAWYDISNIQSIHVILKACRNVEKNGSHVICKIDCSQRTNVHTFDIKAERKKSLVFGRGKQKMPWFGANNPPRIYNCVTFILWFVYVSSFCKICSNVDVKWWLARRAVTHQKPVLGGAGLCGPCRCGFPQDGGDTVQPGRRHVQY